MNLPPSLRRPHARLSRWLVLFAAVLSLAGGGRRVLAQVPGTLDATYNPPVLDQGPLVIAIQPNGEQLLGGAFTTYNGSSVGPLIRLTPSGTLDTNFANATAGNIVAGQVNNVVALAVRADGDIIVSAAGTTNAQNALARLNPAGVVDTTFNEAVPYGVVYGLAYQPDGSANGKLIVGGTFTQIGQGGGAYLVRLNDDGSIDTTFNPPINSASPGLGTINGVNSLQVQPDGKILLLGTLHGASLYGSGLIRLNADGTVDPAFPMVLLSDGSSFSAFSVDTNGNIYVTGTFTAINGQPVSGVARILGADGSVDTATFNAGSAFTQGFNSVVAEPNGQILCGVSGVPYSPLIRFNHDGTLDRDFAPGILLTQCAVTALALQNDGQLFVGGSLVLVNGPDNEPTASFVRLSPSGLTDATRITVGVPGTANPWLAPLYATDTGGDSLTAEAPIFVTGLTLTPGSTISFSVTGSVNYVGSTPVDPPDGASGYFFPHPAENGLGGVNAVVNSLLGVFIDDRIADPSNANAPANLDFSDPLNGVAGGIDYTSLQPALGQVFFIGNGKTSAGAVQPVTVPTGATHLALGTMDGSGWYNNLGAFAVTATTTGVAGGGGGGTTLTATTFTVNGLTQPVAVAAGAPLTFAATQGGTAAPGLSVRVQASMTPGTESSWTDLADTTNGGPGYLKGDGNGNFYLTTSDYPTGANVSFRVISAASNQTDSISTPVGPFDLVNGSMVDLHVDQEATDPSAPNGDLVLYGQQITYTYYVRNYGPATAHGVQVLNVLPSFLHFVSADNSFTTTNVPTDPASGGGTITWNIGDLPPNPTSPIVLNLVVSVTNNAVANKAFANNSFAVLASGGIDIQGTNPILTTPKAPLDLEATSNGSTINPGGQLVYAFTLTNNSGTKAKGVKVDLPLPPNVIFVSALLTDQNGQSIPGSAAPTINPGDVLFDLGTLKINEQVFFHLTVSVPYDADPKLTVSVANAAVTVKKDVGGINAFVVAIPDVKLSGNVPVNPPHFTLYKFIPDGLGILQLLGENPEAKAFLSTLFPNLGTLDGILALGKLVNPDVIDTTDDNGVYQESVLASGEPGGPAVSHITYALVFSNDGGSPAQNVVLTDRIPLGTQLDTSNVYAPTFNGANFGTGQMTLGGDGRTLTFNLHTIKPDKFKATGDLKKASFGLILYTVDLLPPGSGGVSLDSPVQATGGKIDTSSLLQTTYAVPGEIDTPVSAPGAAFLESYKGTAQAVIGNDISYDIYFRNTGGVEASDFRIEDAIPEGTAYKSATFLTNARLPRDPDPSKNETIDPLTNNSITFHAGSIKKGKGGWVRLVVTVQPGALDVPGLVITHHPVVPADVFPDNPRRARRGPPTRATGSADAPTAGSSNASVVQQPASARPIPHLNVAIMVPESVQEGQNYDCLISVANTTDTNVYESAVAVLVPPGAVFVNGIDNSDTFLGTLGQDDAGNPAVIFPASVAKDANTIIDNVVSAHTATMYRVTFLAPTGTAGKALVTSVHTQDATSATNPTGDAAKAVYSTNASTYVYGASQTFADVASQVVASELATQGSSAAAVGSATFKKRVAQTTPATLAHATGGADILALNNNIVAIPLLLPAGSNVGNVVVLGPTANLSALNVSSVVSNDGGSIVAQGGGNLITALNFIGEDGSSIVAQGGGNFQSLLAAIISQDGGGIVAQGGGNLLNVGGNNIISQDGGSVISNDGGSLINLDPAGIVAQGGGNVAASGTAAIVAQGGGNIVAQGGGNIVAQGGGNIVAQGGGNIVAGGGGVINTNGSNLVSQDTLPAISASGAGIVAAGGGNIVAQGGGN